MGMKKVHHLIRLAEKISYKYATVDAESLRHQIEPAIKTALINAASFNDGRLIPFAQMAAQDKVTLSFYINRTGKTIQAYDLKLEPANPNLLSKYQPLMNQVKTYLEKNIDLYPYKIYGDDISYDNFIIHVEYPNENDMVGNS